MKNIIKSLLLCSIISSTVYASSLDPNFPTIPATGVDNNGNLVDKEQHWKSFYNIGGSWHSTDDQYIFKGAEALYGKDSTAQYLDIHIGDEGYWGTQAKLEYTFSMNPKVGNSVNLSFNVYAAIHRYVDNPSNYPQLANVHVYFNDRDIGPVTKFKVQSGDSASPEFVITNKDCGNDACFKSSNTISLKYSYYGDYLTLLKVDNVKVNYIRTSNENRDIKVHLHKDGAGLVIGVGRAWSSLVTSPAWAIGYYTKYVGWGNTIDYTVPTYGEATLQPDPVKYIWLEGCGIGHNVPVSVDGRLVETKSTMSCANVSYSRVSIPYDTTDVYINLSRGGAPTKVDIKTIYGS
ncbi:hypothetical protein [Cysteiniphilum sp. QT6929]|uniref:hypothetical protein n=1 Tax=Cysteiniphilum sp. QT6929 TaxID=2975055 RepID=UPI0024B36A15|nr:hypothetical protein [Cysteiniphilum sp. QT6929]WHN65118.1 hypothetical protein NYP54_08710 [Cysteiniphilum sp. QT6929]